VTNATTSKDRPHAARLAAAYYLGKHTLGYDRFTELHAGWLDLLLRHKKIVLVAPPGHYKSTVATITYPLFRLTEDRNLRIMIINEVLENAKAFLSEIKGHLRDNEEFRAAHGTWHMDADAWTADKIQLRRDVIRKEPTVAAVGVLGTLVSQHPNLIIVDDPCSGRNTQTHSQREKVWQWWRRDLMPRLDANDPEAQIIVVSTRWHRDDLVGRIKADEGYKDWKIVELAAEWKDKAGKQQILFPEKFTPKTLTDLRGTLGTANYHCIYGSSPESVSGTDFKPAWLEQGRYDKLPPDLTVFAGVDLAIGKTQRNAAFAWCVLGVDMKRGDGYVIEAYRDRLPFAEQLKAVKRLNRLHHPRCIIIESNAYQAVFTEVLRTDKESRLLPFKPYNTVGDKHARLRGLAPLYEAGALRHPRTNADWLDNLEQEMLGFPDGTLDMMDAEWLALQGVELQRNEPRIGHADDTDDMDKDDDGEGAGRGQADRHTAGHGAGAGV